LKIHHFKGFGFLEVPDILISNELLEDMRKLADLEYYFKLTSADCIGFKNALNALFLIPS
jgi:hypothetical protein